MKKKLYISPSDSAIKVAKKALERRKRLPKSKRGGLDAVKAHEEGVGSGVMRARDIASGKRIDAYRVKAFFDRHRQNYIDARASGKRWEDSKAWQAWDLWGGEPLRKQVESAVRADKKMRAKSNPGYQPTPSQLRRANQMPAAKRKRIQAAVLGHLRSRRWVDLDYFVINLEPETTATVQLAIIPLIAEGILEARDSSKGPQIRRIKVSDRRAHYGGDLKSNPGRAHKEKHYTIYLVQEKPRTLVLYSFDSKDLLSPSAAASEYSWMLGESALEESGTHIFTSDAKLRAFLRRYKGVRIVRGKPRYPNPRNSKVKDALAAEATRFRDFNEFSEAYWNSCSRGLYWIATNEKRFHIGVSERKKIKDGTFFVSCSPSLALKGKGEGKKYVAELDVTRLPSGSIRSKRGSGGSSIKIIDSPGSIRVMRVLEVAKAKRSFKWQLSILPSSKDELKEVWEAAWKKRRKKAEQKKIQREKIAEREMKREEARAKEEAAASARLEKRAERYSAAQKKKREERGRAAKKKKARAAKVAKAKATASKKRAKARSTVKAAKKASKSTKKKTTKKKAASKKKTTKKKSSKKNGKWVRVKSNPSKRTRRVRANSNGPGKR